MKVKEKRLQLKVKVVIRKSIMLLPDNRFLVFLLKILFRLLMILLNIQIKNNSSHLLLWLKN